MEKIINRYIKKLSLQRLARKKSIAFLGLDDVVFSNKTSKNKIFELSKLFEMMNINSILFAEPAEPYRSIISELIENDYLAQDALKKHGQFIKCSSRKINNDYTLIKKITPMDCETRTFLHDIPVISDFSAEMLAEVLSERKSAIIKDFGIVSCGTVTPEQAFVSYSSTCFALYVKFFSDAINYLEYCFLNKKTPENRFLQVFNKIADYTKKPSIYESFKLKKFQQRECFMTSAIAKKPKNEYEVIKAIVETGKTVVKLHLVDSYFGNISYVFDDNIYISQTGASMDELQSCLDKVPLDGSSSIGITSSSELPTHMKIYFMSGQRAILHTHPKFSVIMSMYCRLSNCSHFNNRERCHTDCTERRSISNVPVVSGEIGTGKTGLLNTVPTAVKEAGTAIVYGHGVFTSGKENFEQALSSLIDIEDKCCKLYFKKAGEYIN